MHDIVRIKPQSTMKKVFLTLCVALFSIAMLQAQQGDMGATLNFNYQSIAVDHGDDINNFGIGFAFKYNILDQVRLDAGFNFGFKNDDDWSYWNTFANVNYLFPLGAVTVYPIAGVSYNSIKIDNDFGDWDDSGFGLTAGGGIELPLTDVLNLNAEMKYNTVGIDNTKSAMIFSLGLTYKL